MTLHGKIPEAVKKREKTSVLLVLNVKKLRLLPILLLLFAALTAIITARVRDEGKAAFAEGISSASQTLIIDAGHGGLDGGAVSLTGSLEKNINLEIAQRLHDLARLCGVRCVMTRETDELPYPESAKTVSQKKMWDQSSRLELINSVENAVLISIHQNIYPDPRPMGAQVLYAGSHGSEELGKMLHGGIVELLDTENRRVAAPIDDSIFLMRNVSCPAALVECGFLSNPEEAQRLETAEYQIKLSEILLMGCLSFMSLY